MPAEIRIHVRKAGSGHEAVCPLLRLTSRAASPTLAINKLRIDCQEALKRMLAEIDDSIIADGEDYDLEDELDPSEYQPLPPPDPIDRKFADRRIVIDDSFRPVPGYSKYVFSDSTDAVASRHRRTKLNINKYGKMSMKSDAGGPTHHLSLEEVRALMLKSKA